MTLVIYNTSLRGKEEFKPMHGASVSMFVCGQTPYDDAHLGHAKTYICFDIVVRWLRHLGYNVKCVQNITDIEDKIIARARERKIDAFELEAYYEKRFMEDMDAIGVRKNVDQYPHSHDYIKQIAEQIQALADNGYAYSVGGDVYYDVSKFEDYTKLSGMKIEDLVKHRIEPDERKRNVYDFALWKEKKPGEPFWDIELKFDGEKRKFSGRPGWHIEDTAMTDAIFGHQYDIHGGASELIFPHHTNEIAQSEAAYGVKPMVKYWMHTGVVNIGGEKMSKSLHNFITIREALAAYSPETLRFFMASTHYRKEINYTDQLVGEARLRLNHIYRDLGMFYNAQENGEQPEDDLMLLLSGFEDEFNAAMNDDFNTPVALMSLSNFVAKLAAISKSRKSVHREEKEEIISRVRSLASVIGILETDAYKEALPKDAADLIAEREEMRKKGDYAGADALRERLKKEFGIFVEDTKSGTIWYK